MISIQELNEMTDERRDQYFGLYFFAYGWLLTIVTLEQKLSVFANTCDERMAGNISRSKFIKQYAKCFKYACRSVKSVLRRGGEEILTRGDGFTKCAQNRYISKQDCKTLKDTLAYMENYRDCQRWNKKYCGGVSHELDAEAEKKIFEEFHPALQRLHKGLNEKAEESERDKKEKDDLTRLFYGEIDQ